MTTFTFWPVVSKPFDFSPAMVCYQSKFFAHTLVGYLDHSIHAPRIQRGLDAVQLGNTARSL